MLFASNIGIAALLVIHRGGGYAAGLTVTEQVDPASSIPYTRTASVGDQIVTLNAPQPFVTIANSSGQPEMYKIAMQTNYEGMSNTETSQALGHKRNVDLAGGFVDGKHDISNHKIATHVVPSLPQRYLVSATEAASGPTTDVSPALEPRYAPPVEAVLSIIRAQEFPALVLDPLSSVLEALFTHHSTVTAVFTDCAGAGCTTETFLFDTRLPPRSAFATPEPISTNSKGVATAGNTDVAFSSVQHAGPIAVVTEVTTVYATAIPTAHNEATISTTIADDVEQGLPTAPFSIIGGYTYTTISYPFNPTSVVTLVVGPATNLTKHTTLRSVSAPTMHTTSMITPSTTAALTEIRDTSTSSSKTVSTSVSTIETNGIWLSQPTETAGLSGSSPFAGFTGGNQLVCMAFSMAFCATLVAVLL